MDNDRMNTNIGQYGIESTRLAGRTIDELPIREAHLAKEQFKLAQDADKENKVANILARYPNQTIEYLESRAKECNENIVRVEQTQHKEEQLISEYTGLISLCGHRAKEVERIENDPSLNEEQRKVQKKELFKQVPPYNIQAMETQIAQSKESIARCQNVILEEYKSIGELKEVLGLCKARDIELQAIGVTFRSTRK